MKKIISILCGIFLSVVMGAGIGSSLYKYNHQVDEEKGDRKDAIYIGKYSIAPLDENIVITNRNEYEKVLGKKAKSGIDFTKYNYALISLYEDGCSSSVNRINDYVIKDDLVKVNVTYKAGCNKCEENYRYFLIPLNKKKTNIDVDINYKAINEVNCDNES